MKFCNKCQTNRSHHEFHKDKVTRDGLHATCKICKKEAKKIWYETNKEKESLYFSTYRKKNKDKIAIKKSEYYLNNKERINKRHAINNKEKYQTDICFKLKCNLRSRFYQALKKNYKSGSAVKDLGCSIEEFKIYLESKFDSTMTWENYGEWHIDHIKALVHFNLSNIEELKKACHYTNLQPMWKTDNLKKGVK